MRICLELLLGFSFAVIGVSAAGCGTTVTLVRVPGAGQHSSVILTYFSQHSAINWNSLIIFPRKLCVQSCISVASWGYQLSVSHSVFSEPLSQVLILLAPQLLLKCKR